MPRGIPKDPNHPRNKKKTAETTAATPPKRRGRPPGSKNAAKATSQPAVSAKVSAPVRSATHAVATTRNDHIDIVRANISVLASCGPHGVNALHNQIDQLMKLTAAVVGEQDTEVQPTQNSGNTSIAPQVASLPSPPSFAPPPFPPHLPGQS